MQEMAGEIAFEYMKETGEPLQSIEVVSLLLDFHASTAQVFKVCVGFHPDRSKIYQENESLDVSDALKVSYFIYLISH